MMYKLLFCLGLVLSSVYSQTCSDTSALRTRFGFANTLSSGARTYSDINFCMSIKTGPVCCTDTDMNSFQSKSDAFIASLTTSAATRDKAFSTVQNPQTQLAAALASFQTAASSSTGGLAALITAANSSGALIPMAFTGFGSSAAGYTTGTSSGTNSSRILADASTGTSINIYQSIAHINEIITSLTASINAVTAGLSTYQTTRSACIVEMYKTQAAVWCLSCDQNATLKGYDSTANTISLGPSTCTRLKSACFPYLNASTLQNAAFNALELINTLQWAAGQISAGKNPMAGTYTYTGPTPAAFPSSCTSADSCNWICTTLLSTTGLVNNPYLIAGGILPVGVTSRLLEEEEERVLVIGSFDPSPNEAGTTVAFSNDPGNINSGSGKSGMLTYGSVLGGMIAMVWSMMM